MKKTLALLAVLCLLLTSLPVGMAVAAEDVSGINLPDDDFIIEDEGNFDDDGYVAISSLEDLEAIRDDLTGNYYLDADIVIPEGTEFAPIGSADEPFIGTFDGSGHTITGLVMNVEDGTENVGLFGYNCGIIYGLGLVDSVITVDGYANVGSIAGYNAGGTITDCYSTGTVTVVNADGASVGGIVGYNDFEGKVADCYNIGDITVDGGYVGGIAGSVLAAAVETSYNVGTITATDAIVGGVVAYGEEAVVTDCYFVGEGLEDEFATALTAEEAAVQDSFAGFDFEAVWTMEGISGYAYPELRAVNLEGDFEVEEVVITGIEVTTLPKTSYTVGDALDLTGGILTVTYSDGTTAEVALADTEVTGFDGAAAGTQTLTVAYEGFTATYDVVVEEKVVAIVTVAIASTGLKLTWNAVDGATSYVITRAEVVDDVAGEFTTVTTVSSASYTDTSVVAGTKYQYRVIAKSGSTELEVAVSAAVAFVKAPTGALTNVVDGLKMTWADAGADSYEVWRAAKDDATNKYEEFQLIGTTAELFYVDTNVNEGIAYAYKVRPVSGGVTGSYSAQVATRRLTSPSVTLANYPGSVKITWEENEYAAKYYVYRSALNATTGVWGSWTRLVTVDKASSTYVPAYTDLTAKNGTTYRYKLVSILSTTTGADGEEASILRLTVSSLGASNQTAGIQLEWAANTAAEQYYLYRSEEVNGEWTAWGQPFQKFDNTVTSFLDTTAVNGVKYRYMVRTVNGEYMSGAKMGAYLFRLESSDMTLANESGGIRVSWTKNEAASKYFIYRSVYENGAWSGWTRFISVAASTTSYLDTSVNNPLGAQYRYMIRTNKGDNQSMPKASSAITRLRTPGLKLSSTTSGIKMTWTPVAGATTYKVYRCELDPTTSTYSDWTEIAADVPGTDGAYVDATAVKGTTYKYSLLVVNVTINGTSTSYLRESSALAY